MTRPTRIAALYLALVFVAGALLGVVADRYYERTARAGPPPPPRDFRARFVSNLQKDLALTPEQVTQVTTILDETGKRFRDLRERMGPEFEAIRQVQQDRIRAVLTPEQKIKYEGILEEHRRNRDKHHGPR